MSIIELETALNNLASLESNLKKSINTRYLRNTLLEKKRLSEKLYTSITLGLASVQSTLSDIEIFKIKTISAAYFNNIQQILSQKLQDRKRIISFKVLSKVIILCNRFGGEKTALKSPEVKQENKMPSTPEIIKITTSLIPQYDGNGEKLGNIIAALTALKTIVEPESEATAVQIVLSKLERKARSAVGETPADIDAIINNLKQKCAQSISPDVIVAKLNVTRQTG